MRWEFTVLGSWVKRYHSHINRTPHTLSHHTRKARFVKILRVWILNCVLVKQMFAFRLLTLCTKHLGSVAANTVRVFKPDQLPLLLIISRSRGIAEVVQVLHGTCFK